MWSALAVGGDPVRDGVGAVPRLLRRRRLVRVAGTDVLEVRAERARALEARRRPRSRGSDSAIAAVAVVSHWHPSGGLDLAAAAAPRSTSARRAGPHALAAAAHSGFLAAWHDPGGAAVGPRRLRRPAALRAHGPAHAAVDGGAAAAAGWRPVLLVLRALPARRRRAPARALARLAPITRPGRVPGRLLRRRAAHPPARRSTTPRSATGRCTSPSTLAYLVAGLDVVADRSAAIPCRAAASAASARSSTCWPRCRRWR